MTASADKTVLKIAAIGIDDHMRRLLSMAFQGPGKGCCTLSNVENAHVFIFNFDHVDGQTLWEKYHKAYPSRPAIIMALTDPNIANTVFLKKPFRIESLLDALRDIKTEKHQAPEPDLNIDTLKRPEALKLPTLGDDQEFVGNQKDIDLSNVASLANIYYKPSDYLQEQIFYASRISNTDKVAVQVAVKLNDKWELITFLPTLQGVFTTLTDFQLRVICTAPKYCSETKLHRYSLEETLILENGPRTKTSIQKTAPFLWKVALWTSRGRIPEGTSLSAPMKLKQWPNFTRLHTTPNCMRISTLLMDDARPLKIVAKVLNVPQRHVFAFYSASYALGLMNNLGGTRGEGNASLGKKHKQHSLLSRILRKLTGVVTN